MATIQSGRNVSIAYKVETAFNVVPTDTTGGNRFRPNQSPGMSFKRQTIAPNEIRPDLKTSMARLGFGETSGSYAADASVGTFDPLLEAITRGTWSAALVITTSAVGGVQYGANTITGSSGSWLTSGIRVGDVIRMSGTGATANNNRNLRVTGVAPLVITVAETLTTTGALDTSGSLTRLKKVYQPTVPVRRSFTIEQYDGDIDQSEQYTGCRASSLKVTGQPNGMCLVDFGFVGASVNPLTTAASPVFTTPVLSPSIGLVIADATIRYAGADVVTLTSFDFTLDNKASTTPIVGATVTPDVFDNAAMLSGTFSAMRMDLTNLTKFTSETELELHLLLVEPMSEPKNCLSIFIPRLKLTGTTAPFGADGAMIESLPWMAADKGVVTGYDATMIAFSTSAP
jgi:hypothetical protein